MFRRRNLAILLFFTGIFILISCKGDDERRDYADGIESRMAPNQSMEISDARPLMSSKSMTPPFPQVISGTNNEVTERNSKEIQNIAADRISSTDETAESVSTTRMIIRNGSMEISVIEIESSIEYIKAAVADLGGWVVASRNDSSLSGSLVVRIPSEALDDFLTIVALHSDEVISTATDSRDVTDEYIDNTSRLTSLEASEKALVGLLDRSSSVEEILKIRKELKTIQGDIEAFKGRIKYLEQSSAFSKVELKLNLTPKKLIVNSGDDLRTAVGKLVRLKALFVVPEGSEEFTYIWDFGDGSPLHYGNRTAPTTNPNKRTTATVSHVYNDNKDSPFIAKIEIVATGESGIFKGEDSSIISVTRMPTIEVFAGDYIEAEEGEELSIEASFTRPPEVESISYKWEFGDGRDTDITEVSGNESRITQSHIYNDHRSYPYRALVTVYGETESGTVEGVGEVIIRVDEAPGWTVGNIDIVNTAKFSVRSLSVIGYGLIGALIWLAILSPIWATIIVVTWFAVRYIQRRKRPADPST